jgi:maleate isomerase
MRDVLGWRAKFGVLGPSTNTIVQPDFEMMRPPGVTNHYSRIFTPNAQAVSNETFMAGTQVIGENTLALGDDQLAGLPGDGHVGRDLLWRVKRARTPSRRRWKRPRA